MGVPCVTRLREQLVLLLQIADLPVVIFDQEPVFVKMIIVLQFPPLNLIYELRSFCVVLLSHLLHFVFYAQLKLLFVFHQFAAKSL